jgi:dihydroorotase
MSKILVVAHGRVIDSANGIDGIRHIVVRDGVIAAVQEDVPLFSAEEAPRVTTFDATGLVVCPGLVDMHAHLYTHVTPLGVDVDHYCVGRGVTTCVDAGSAGASTLPGLREFIAKRSTTRVLAFVNIALHGLAAAGCTGSGTGGELDSLNQCSVDHCVAAVRANRDLVVGIKIRLSGDAADNGRNEPEAFRRALAVSEQADVPLMTHHTFSEIPLGTREGGGSGSGAASIAVDGEAASSSSLVPTGSSSGGSGGGDSRLGCPGSLRRGDIYTHTYHGFASTIIDVGEGRMAVDPAVWEARERGVLFDVGHGQGSFNWTVVRACNSRA